MKAEMKCFQHSFQSLHEATLLTEVDVCKFLLKFGVPLDARNELGQTALMIAAEAGHRELIELYLAYDASLDLIDSDGHTALMLAASKGHSIIVQLLMKAGANTALLNDRGESALTIAQRYGQFATAALLSQDKKASWWDCAQAWYRFARNGWER